MKLAGRITVGQTPTEIAQDTKRVARIRMPQDGNVAKGSMYLDGLGSGGVGTQACRQVIYDTLNNLVAVSDEVLVPMGKAAGWTDFSYSSYRGKLALVAGDYYVGIHAGAYTNTIRVYGSDPHGDGGKWNADTYTDGASAVFGAATAVTADLSSFLLYFAPYANVTPRESMSYFAQLPFETAQYVLGLGGPEDATKRLVTVGWHYTSVDSEQGSVALVRSGSNFADLVGERVRVETLEGREPRSVIAFVRAVGPSDLDWDLSLTRTLYARLALLADDPFTVAVSRMGMPT